jgi:HNH endonuclease
MGYRDHEPLAQRYWKKVYKTANCWFWIGAIRPGTFYGSITISNRSHDAHRVAWFMAYGVWPPKGMWVLHRCDIRQCVNPDHLFLGTSQDNQRDSGSKGHVSTMPQETCKRGHKFDRTRVRFRHGHLEESRWCSICNKRPRPCRNHQCTNGPVPTAL